MGRPGRQLLGVVGAHAECLRPNTLFYPPLLGILGLLAVGNTPTVSQYVAAVVPVTLAWMASLYGGDYFDRHLDAISKPHRPVPSGRVSATFARNAMVVLIITGGVIAVSVTRWSLFVVAGAGVTGVAYAWWLKGRGLWGNFMRGVPSLCAVIYGALIASSEAGPDRVLAVLVIGMAWLVHDAYSNLIGALCDRDGDARAGCATYPARRGDAATLAVLKTLGVSWVALLAAAAWQGVLFADHTSVGGVGLMLLGLLLQAHAFSLLMCHGAPVARCHAVRSHNHLVVARVVLACGLILLLGGPGWVLLAVCGAGTVLGLVFMGNKVKV